MVSTFPQISAWLTSLLLNLCSNFAFLMRPIGHPLQYCKLPFPTIPPSHTQFYTFLFHNTSNKLYNFSTYYHHCCLLEYKFHEVKDLCSSSLMSIKSLNSIWNTVGIQ